MRRAELLVAAWLAAWLLGCGSDRPETIAVEGTVTLDGAPLADAAVQFIPTAGGHPAIGSTDAAGRFTLSTFDAGDGALPGAHRVTVQKNRVIGGVDAEGRELPPAVGAPAIEWLIPQRYSQAETSGLTTEVVRGMPPVALPLHSGSDP